MHDQELKDLRAKNLRIGLILAGIALALFASIIIKTWAAR